MEKVDLKFDNNRRRVKYCPCGKSNKDGKFVPYKGYEKNGFCHSCGETFLPKIDSSEYKIKYTPIPPQPTSYHKPNLIAQSGRNFQQNNFIQFLKTMFNEDEVKAVILKYLIGTSKHRKGATVFWQIDNEQRVRAGKIMLYDSHNGSSKDVYGNTRTNWVHAILKLRNFNLKQCLFGLHLINEVATRTVAIVEGEKTAIIMSLFKPEYVWLATGGKGQFKYETLKALKGFKIIAFPDKSEYSAWQDKAMELKEFGFNISVSKYLENTIYKDGTDFADVFIIENRIERKPPKIELIQSTAENIALKLIKINPALRNLIKEFDLTDTNGQSIDV